MDSARIDPDRLRRALLRVLAPGLVVRVIEESTVDAPLTYKPTREQIEAEIERQEARCKLRGRSL